MILIALIHFAQARPMVLAFFSFVKIHKKSIVFELGFCYTLHKLVCHYALTGMPDLRFYFELELVNMLTVYISTQRRKSGRFHQGWTL